MTTPPHVRSRYLSFFAQRGRVFLYHDLTGNVLEMSPDLMAFVERFETPTRLEEIAGDFAFGPEEARRFARIFADNDCLVPEGSDELAKLWRRVPVQARWVVLHREGDALTAVVSRGDTGPEAEPRLVSFDAWQTALWDTIDGELTTEALHDLLRARFPAETTRRRVEEAIAEWASSPMQLVRVSPKPLSAWSNPRDRPQWLFGTMPYARVGRSTDVAPPADAHTSRVDTGPYHEQTVSDASAQFDDVETTLSHLFREPHEALGGCNWGERMACALVERELLRDAPEHAGAIDVLEVGGGTGILTRAILDTLARDQAPLHARLAWRIVDRSPVLNAAQRARLTENAAHAGHAVAEIGDIESMALRPASVDLVFSNEVLADLHAVRVRRAALDPAKPAIDADEAKAVSLIRALHLDVGDEEEFLLNVGALELVPRVARALRKGGAALLTEFGTIEGMPRESTHLDHPEVSIQFTHLCRAATAAGLEATILPVADLVGLDPSVRILATTRTHFRNLRALAASRGVVLDKLAWTPEMWAERCGDALPRTAVRRLEWQPAGLRVMGLRPDDFLALVLRKPADVTAREAEA